MNANRTKMDLNQNGNVWHRTGGRSIRGKNG